MLSESKLQTKRRHKKALREKPQGKFKTRAGLPGGKLGLSTAQARRRAPWWMSIR